MNEKKLLIFERNKLEYDHSNHKIVELRWHKEENISLERYNIIKRKFENNNLYLIINPQKQGS